jgi:hypothetical protein
MPQQIIEALDIRLYNKQVAVQTHYAGSRKSGFQSRLYRYSFQLPGNFYIDRCPDEIFRNPSGWSLPDWLF